MIIRASKSGIALCLVLTSTGFFTSAEAQTPERAQQGDPDWRPPRTEWGHPDLQGTWNNTTLTSFERGPGLGPVYTEAEAIEREQRSRSSFQGDQDPSDPDREPPARSEQWASRSSNLIYYNADQKRVARVNGEPRTSLITFPPDGRIPELTPEGQKRKQKYHDFRSQFGPYDHPELLPMATRCIAFYGSSYNSTMGPPMTPSSGYNNNIQIVQNADHVLIFTEMVHDARIVKLGKPDPLPKHVRPWFGDSWGHWEGNTLVIETTNIHLDMGYKEQRDKIPNSEDLQVIERLTRVADDSILYEFEIRDPRTYTEVWGGQIPWVKFDQQIYEYACHEGNYALANILSGARYEEEGMEAREPR
jgi:hypothetical protein